MGTKSFLLLRQWHHSFFLAALLLFAVTSCTTSQKQADPQREETQNAADTSVSVGTRPKIGLLLGPGGMKAYAHIGVLRELEKAKIPVHAIVGLEWGSLVGAFYSATGKANEVEWQMLKIEEKSLPTSSLLKSGLAPVSTSALDGFLKRALQDKTFEDARPLFACPAQSFNGEKIIWNRRGPLHKAALSCVPYPPLYTAAGEWVAAPTEIASGAQKLREMGAEVIVLVDVLAKGSLFKGANMESDYETKLLWSQAKKALEDSHSQFDFVIGVHTRDYAIVDAKARRSIILFGTQSGMIAAKKLQEKYGY